MRQCLHVSESEQAVQGGKGPLLLEPDGGRVCRPTRLPAPAESLPLLHLANSDVVETYERNLRKHTTFSSEYGKLGYPPSGRTLASDKEGFFMID